MTETRSRLSGWLRNGNRNLQHAIADHKSNVQACSFNHSDISPSLESTVYGRPTPPSAELCQTSQTGAIIYRRRRKPEAKPRIPRCVARESRKRQNGSMKTTIDIPEKELRDAMRFTRATTKREAVVKVLEEFNRRRRMAELVKYSGTFSDRFPGNDEIEAIDAKRDRDLHARTRR